MQCDKLSVSRAKLFADGKGCPLKYQLRYEEKIRPDQLLGEETYFTLGKCVHHALEFFLQPGSAADDPQELFLSEARRVGLLDMQLIKDGKRIIKVFMENLQREGMPDVLETEMEFDFYTDLGVPLFGYIDRVDKIDDQSVKITDYKTGNYVPTQAEAEADLQLPVYHIAVVQKYPWVKNVELCYHYLKTNTRLSFRITQQRIEETLEYLHHVYQSIIDHPGGARGKVSMFCSYCDYKTICPEYKLVINEHYSLFADYDRANIDLITVEYEDLDARSKILSKRVDHLKGILKDHVKFSSGPVTLKDGRILDVQSGRIKIDKPKKA